MRDKYLGDSYDLLKRTWAATLRTIAPLFAHSFFVPGDIQAAYTGVTSIPFLLPNSEPSDRFGLLFDPDTGVPLPDGAHRGPTQAYAPIRFIAETYFQLRPTYLICFDQSYHRKHLLSRDEQRGRKLEALRSHGLVGFYYVSHAPFLFASSSQDSIECVRDELLKLGIPSHRLQA